MTQIQTWQVAVQVRGKGLFYAEVRAHTHWGAVKAAMRAVKADNDLNWLTERVDRVEVRG